MAASIITVTATKGVGDEAVGVDPDFIFTFTRDGDTSAALSVIYSLVETNQLNGASLSDLDAPPQGLVHFQPGSATATLQFNARDDSLFEPTESFFVRVEPAPEPSFGRQLPYLVGIENTVTGQIIDDDKDGKSFVSIQAQSEAHEGETVQFHLHRDGDVTDPLSVRLTFEGSTYVDYLPPGLDASNEQDYRITFAAGSADVDLNIAALDDTFVEGPEQFTVKIAPDPLGSYVPDANSTGVGTILDNDLAPYVTSVNFQNGAGVYDWLVDGPFIARQGGIDLFDPTFSVQVTGDFNGDGETDIAFENPNTGGVWQWQVSALTILHQGAVDVADPSFNLLGSADFNGDGKDDLLWRNDAGVVYIWTMDGFDNTLAPVSPLAPEWHIQGARDFDGDGNADLLLRNSSNTPENDKYYLWYMDGGHIVGEAHVTDITTSWQTLAVGDFDGDGKADIATWDTESQFGSSVTIYLMDGATVKSQTTVGFLSPSFDTVQLVDDLNGDGTDDILFRTDNGFFFSWTMSNGFPAEESFGFDAITNGWADPAQHVISPHWELV